MSGKIAACVAFLLMLLAVSSLILIVASRHGRLSVERLKSNDPRVQAAIQQAQNGLGPFLQELSANSKGRRFAIMAGFRTSSGPEYLWIKDPAEHDGAISGTLDQVPMVANYRKGDPVTVRRTDVVDWLIQEPDGTIRGGFTQRIGD